MLYELWNDYVLTKVSTTLTTMGNCLSGAPKHLIESHNGGEEEYHKRFLEDKVLGEGEFGTVKLVHDMTSQGGQEMACKVLRKGVTFKDNTLYAPLKPHVLKGEIQMLRALSGQKYCMKLEAVYESPTRLYLVTELCIGGEMQEWVSRQTTDLRTEDVSRIAYEMFSAINHCYTHHVIHRDIKPENIMFTDPTISGHVRLIDFGSGTIDDPSNSESQKINGLQVHTTFAGSAFYISPEMFQHEYTAITDVWSLGATLYVLVAGYPADNLQKAFNILQTSKNRNLKKLPNIPQDMPDSFYELLERSLTYWYKKRPTAGEILKNNEFIAFHQTYMENGLSLDEVRQEVAAAAGAPNKKNATISSLIEGSVVRHTMFLGFQQFERAVTTLLAAMLSKTDLGQLLTILQSKVDEAEEKKQEEKDNDDGGDDAKNNKLSVVKVRELKKILQNDLNSEQVVETMAKIPNSDKYEDFAYHTTLLSEFGVGNNDAGGKGSFRAKLTRGDSFSNHFKPGQLTNSNSSQRSVHGSNVFKSFKQRGGGRKMPRSNSIK